MATSNAPRQKGLTAKKDGTSNHNVRGSPGAKETRPNTAPTVTKATQSTKRAKSSTQEQSKGSMKGKEPVSRGAEEQHTKKRAWENANVERDKEKAEWEKENVNLQRSLEEEKHKAKTTEMTWENEMKELQEKNESERERLRKKIEELEESLSNGKEDNNALQKKYNQLEQDLEREFNEKNTEWEKYCKHLTKKHTNETEQLQKTIKSLTVEKDKLLTRLSTIASDRFTHDNVNIVDLSDADRSTKLQERYSEIYDNEWTDAFEELLTHDNITEDDAIMILLKILMSSFHNCREITWGRYERLKNVASSVYIEEEISMPSPKVMSNVSEPVLTTQEADSSRAQLDKNDEKTSDTDNNLDTIQDGTASRESRENNEMHVVNEKAFKVIDVKVNVVSGHSSSIGNLKDKFETLKFEDGKNGANKHEASDEQSVNEAPKDKFENKKGKKGANKNEYSDDQCESEAPKDKSDNKKGKKGANKNEDSDDQYESEAPKDKSDNKKGKNGANKHEASDQSVNEAPKDKFENKKGKKGADKNEDTDNQCESEAPNVKSDNKKGKKGANKNEDSYDQCESEAPKDKSDNEKGKNDGNKNEGSDDQSSSEAPKNEFENKKERNDASKKVESDDQSVSEAPKDKFEDKKRKNGAIQNEASDGQSVSDAPKEKFEKKNGKHLLCTMDLNVDLIHDIMSIWRKTTLELKGIAAEPLSSVIETCLDMQFIGQPKTSEYLKSCIDLCWKMGVQQRPLHMDGFAEMDAYAGKKFDKDKFRVYTRSGSHVAFFVWPTLYLYEGGPILAKGIVQCCSPVEA